MWNGYRKALTFSYDDGVVQDARLVKILNEYGLKGTFNLNSGIMTPESRWEYRGAQAVRMAPDGLKELYRGHEIAVHGVTHADLTGMTRDEMLAEIGGDRKALEELFGCIIKGMAYDYVTQNGAVESEARDCGIRWARTTVSTGSFGIGPDPLVYNPTCHHADEAIFRLAERFVSDNGDEDMLFYIWGHSYEFDADGGSWGEFERLCKYLSGRSDIFYCTNSEALCAG